MRGQPVGHVFLHGYTGGPSSWERVVACLRPAQGLRPTLPGHCGQPVVDGGFSANIDALAARIRRELVQPAHLIGYSMGARLGLAMLARHTELFARATLVAANPGLRTERERRLRRAADAKWSRLLRDRGLAAFISNWERLPIFATQSADMRVTQRKVRDSHSPRQLADAMDSLGLAQMPDYRPFLRTTTLPLQLLVGDHDAKFANLAGELCLDNSMISCCIVPGSGHNLPLEAPGSVARAVEAFDRVCQT